MQTNVWNFEEYFYDLIAPLIRRINPTDPVGII